MAQRLVSLIDADAKLAAHLQSELARYGLTVEIEADPNDLMSRKDGLPELVVLCIDPKRTGWAVCNRLRKSPVLKTIPLIITSAEATEKDFDDHKKLKTRAEEYLQKPFSVEALIDKIGTLIGLAPAEAEANEIEVESEIGEIEVEAEDGGMTGQYLGDDEMTSGGAALRSAPPADAFDSGEEESTRIGFPSEVDGEVDLETNAAFAAIGLDDPAEPATNVREDASSPFDDDPFGAPDAPAPEDELVAAPVIAAASAPHAVTVSQAPADTDSVPMPKLDAEDLDLGLEDVARDAEAMSATAEPVMAAVAATPVRAERNDAALEEARHEIDKLRRELEEQRAKPRVDPVAASSFSREREFLNLRETINKKEKEVLDLKDGLDSKDRQLLDGKEKLRDAERKTREAEERSLVTERELVAAREKMEALSSDKERGIEREKQVKGRLEDAQKAQQRLERELEQWRAKHAADTAALEEKHTQAATKQREEMGLLRQSHAEALAELKTEHTSTVGKLEAAHDLATQAAQTRLAESMAKQADEHRATLEKELKAAERRQGEALVDLESQHDSALATTKAQHDEALANVRAQHESALRALVDEGRRALEQALAERAAAHSAQEAAHDSAVRGLAESHTEALATQAEEAAAQHADALVQQTQEHETELKAAREQQARKLQALEESHEDLKAGMQARHGAQLEEVRKQHAGQVSTFEASVAERDHLIEQQREARAEIEVALTAEQGETRARTQQIELLVAELEAAQADASAKAAALEERSRRISELEQESARYQDQILRAYQRIKTDESTVTRAKKALAIALTLLEENDADTTGASTSPEQAQS